MDQKIITSQDNYRALDSWIENNKIKNLLLVCDNSFEFQKSLKKHMDTIDTSIITFSNFIPNPLYESVAEGVLLFRNKKCDGIFAVGGGSAIDVAKCIKLYSNMNPDENYLNQEIVPNNIPFIAMPTTAGTGSEATRYAVIYFNGEKQSVTSESCIPETVLLDHNSLKSLPLYQKKSTMMDALCHAVESYWSVNSNDESKDYSIKAIKGILENMEGYIANTEKGNQGMLMSAHYAGKAINITQTTAGHAMCYKLTSTFGISHGHAAILCDRVLFPWMVDNTGKCIDSRGEDYLKKLLDEIAGFFGYASAQDGKHCLEEVFARLDLEVPVANDEIISKLKTSVNPVRLKNHPVQLDLDSIEMLYRKMLLTENY